MLSAACKKKSATEVQLVCVLCFHSYLIFLFLRFVTGFFFLRLKCVVFKKGKNKAQHIIWMLVSTKSYRLMILKHLIEWTSLGSDLLPSLGVAAHAHTLN